MVVFLIAMDLRLRAGAEAIRRLELLSREATHSCSFHCQIRADLGEQLFHYSNKMPTEFLAL
jgi:hypothetical protein